MSPNPTILPIQASHPESTRGAFRGSSDPQADRTEAAPWIGQPFIANWPIYLPLAGLLAMSLLFRWTAIDCRISAWFYDRTTASWPWFHSAWCTFFYRGGTYPAVAIATTGGVLLAAGLLQKNRSWSRAGLFLLMVFGLGPGLVVNYALKEHWGRPRPHQLTQFGGQFDYVPVGSMGPLTTHNSSFPSGHAAVAFYLIAPAFVIHAGRPRFANGLLAVGLIFGAGMSVTRVMQGGHFASDVLWSAGIVYLTCVLVARGVLFPRQSPRESAVPRFRANRAA